MQTKIIPIKQTDFKLCTNCKHYLHRHELDNSCAMFKTNQDVLTGYATYKHVREARESSSMCGDDAKLYEEIAGPSTTEFVLCLLIPVVFILMFIMYVIVQYVQA